MLNPLYALLIGIAVLGLAGILFWPKKGLMWWLQTRRELTEKVLVEDTLKYIYKCERNNQTASLESLAGALSTSLAHASEILALTQAALSIPRPSRHRPSGSITHKSRVKSSGRRKITGTVKT